MYVSFQNDCRIYVHCWYVDNNQRLFCWFHFISACIKRKKNYINWQNTHFHFDMEEETRTYMKVENRDVAPNLHKYVSIYVYNTGIFYHLCRVPMVYMKLCKEILRKNLIFSVKIYKIFMPSFVFLFMMC